MAEKIADSTSPPYEDKAVTPIGSIAVFEERDTNHELPI